MISFCQWTITLTTALSKDNMPLAPGYCKNIFYTLLYYLLYSHNRIWNLLLLPYRATSNVSLLMDKFVQGCSLVKITYSKLNLLYSIIIIMEKLEIWYFKLYKWNVINLNLTLLNYYTITYNYVNRRSWTTTVVRWWPRCLSSRMQTPTLCLR